MSPSDYSWTSSLPGLYTRALDPMEYLYGATAPNPNTSHWVMGVQAQFIFTPSATSPSLTTAITRAWRQLRLLHPSIANAITNYQCTHHTLSSPDDLASWSDTTLTFITDNTPTATWEAFIIRPPSIELYVFPSPSTDSRHHLLLRVPHDITDGIGAIQLLHNLFSALASPLPPASLPTPWVNPGQEAAQLSNSTFAAFPFPVTTQKHIDTATQRLVATGTAAAQGLANIPLNPQRGLRRNRFASLQLSVEESTQISKACRVRGITVTHAVQAAVILATAASSPDKDPKPHNAFIVADLRRRLEPTPECKDHPHPAVARMWTFPLVTAGETIASGFDAVANAVKEGYEALHEEPLGIFAVTARVMGDVVRAAKAGDTAASLPTGNSPGLSSLGVLERGILAREYNGDGGRVRVEEVWLKLELANQEANFHLLSWNGSIGISVSWNEEFFEDEVVHGLMRGVRRELEKGLRIDLKTEDNAEENV